jgi:hypothetical protein
MKKYFLKLSIMLISIMAIISCEPNPIENASKNNSKKDLLTSFQLPSDGEFGSFYVLRSYDKFSNSEFADQDTMLASKFQEIGPSNESAFYIGDNLKIDYCKINGQYYQESTYASGTHYQQHNPTLFLGTEGNIFEWSINNQVFRDTLVYNAPEVAITAPTFMELVPRNQGLTITWEPSSTDNDAVEISLNGVPMSTDTTTHVSYYTSGIIDDNGSFTVPAQILNTFNEPKIKLSISRGAYKESIHNNQKYLFLIYTGYGIDVMLQ